LQEINPILNRRFSPFPTKITECRQGCKCEGLISTSELPFLGHRNRTDAGWLNVNLPPKNAFDVTFLDDNFA